MTDRPIAATGRKAAVSFIFVTLVLDIMAIGIIIPVLPNLILSLEGGDMERATVITGIFGVSWAIMQFVFQPILGAISDRYGRRPVLLISMAGLGIDYVVMALAPNLTILFLGRLVSGIAAATFSTANAYIADVTPPEKRAAAFGMLGAAFGLGFVLGPALGGYLGGIDQRLPFWISAGLCIVNALYGYFVLPESLPQDRRKALSLSSFNPFAALTFLFNHPQIAGFALLVLIYNLAHNVFPAVWVLNMNHRFGWDEQMTGFSLAAVGALGIAVQGGLVGPIVKSLGERRAIILGLCLGATGMAGYGLAPSAFWVWATMPVMAFWAIYGPAAQSVMTQHVGPTEQGQLQGALGGLMGIASIITPFMYTQVFAYAIGPGKGLALPGLPFLLAAALLAGAVFIAVQVTRGLGAPGHQRMS